MKFQSKSLFGAAFAITAAVLTASPASAVLVVYEPFADGNSSLNGNAAGTGLSGNWTAASGFTVGAGSLSYGSLPTSGNQVAYSGGNANSSVALSSALSNAGLLNDGATVWFSMIVNTPDAGGSNADTGFAIGTDPIIGTNNIPMTAGGEGIGWAIKNDQLRAATWKNAKNQAIGTGVATDTTIFIVGEIIWGANGAANDTINLYLPNTSLIKGAIKSTQVAVLNQANFDLITTGLKTNTGYGFDEIRFGSSFEDVIGLDTSAVPEPATASLALLGLGGLMMRRRRMA